MQIKLDNTSYIYNKGNKFEKRALDQINLEINIQKLDLALLAVTIVVSIKCILFLFYDSVQKVSTSSKYLYLLGYITLPFIFITKISFI